MFIETLATALAWKLAKPALDKLDDVAYSYLEKSASEGNPVAKLGVKLGKARREAMKQAEADYKLAYKLLQEHKQSEGLAPTELPVKGYLCMETSNEEHSNHPNAFDVEALHKQMNALLKDVSPSPLDFIS